MSNESKAAEVLEVLTATREYAKFFGELGIETVAVPADLADTSAARGRDEDPAARMTCAPASTPATSPLFERRTAAGVAKKAAIAPGAPQDSLFGASGPAAQVLQSSDESLEQIWRDIGDCTRCGLCEGRTQVVNTHGNRKARLMFIGEAPGADEDAQGKPFVGRAGQLLTKMIEAMGLKREDVIIGNVNRCRPPGNRQPTLEEAAICRPFLFREIAVIQPEVIVVMGNTALRNLLEVREGISRVRGQFQDFRGIKVMPTFHPAYLLRDPSKKRETWEDLKKVMEYLEKTTPKSGS